MQEAIRRFVQRDLIGLLSEVGFLSGVTLSLGRIRVATNRVDVEVLRADQPASPLQLTWEEDAGRLMAQISRPGWLEQLEAGQRAMLIRALSGLFTRAGVEQVRGAVEVPLAPPMAWSRWLALWSPPLGPPPRNVAPAPRTANLCRVGPGEPNALGTLQTRSEPPVHQNAASLARGVRLREARQMLLLDNRHRSLVGRRLGQRIGAAKPHGSPGPTLPDVVPTPFPVLVPYGQGFTNNGRVSVDGCVDGRFLGRGNGAGNRRRALPHRLPGANQFHQHR